MYDTQNTLVFCYSYRKWTKSKARLEWSFRLCISEKSSGDANIAVPKATL